MKKAIYLTIAALALLLAFLAGCAVTIRCAVPVGAAQNTNGYIISYRYGGYWLNELYEGRTEQRPSQAKNGNCWICCTRQCRREKTLC